MRILLLPLLATAHCILPSRLTSFGQDAAALLLPTAYRQLPTAFPLSLRSSGMSLRSNCQLPTAYCLLPTAYYLLPTAIPLSLRSSGMSLRSNCQLPTANCQPPTANCQLPSRSRCARPGCRFAPTANYQSPPATTPESPAARRPARRLRFRRGAGKPPSHNRGIGYTRPRLPCSPAGQPARAHRVPS